MGTCEKEKNKFFYELFHVSTFIKINKINQYIQFQSINVEFNVSYNNVKYVIVLIINDKYTKILIFIYIIIYLIKYIFIKSEIYKNGQRNLINVYSSNNIYLTLTV